MSLEPALAVDGSGEILVAVIPPDYPGLHGIVPDSFGCSRGQAPFLRSVPPFAVAFASPGYDAFAAVVKLDVVAGIVDYSSLNSPC